MPQVEEVSGLTYTRAARIGGVAGVLVTDFSAAAKGEIVASFDARVPPKSIESAVNQLGEPDFDVQPVEAQLRTEAWMSNFVNSETGLRVPGTVDGFELLVRAILGQQISVAGARTMAARVAATFGPLLERPHRGVTRLFPLAHDLATARLEGIGIPRLRAAAIREAARLVLGGTLRLQPGETPRLTYDQLLTIRGIGPWTAGYTLLRAVRDRDACPVGDLGLRQVVGTAGSPASPAEVAAAFEQFRPWRGYATLYCWTALLRAASSESVPNGDAG